MAGHTMYRSSILIILATILLTGCSSFGNIGNLLSSAGGAATGAAIGGIVTSSPLGPIAGAAVGSVTADVIIPDSTPSITNIETNQQLWAYIVNQGLQWFVYGGIILFVLWSLVLPYIAHRIGLNKESPKESKRREMEDMIKMMKQLNKEDN